MLAPPENSADCPEILQNVSLKEWNTLRVEAWAERFVTVQSEAEINQLNSCEKLAREHLWILGGGSNVLFKGVIRKLIIKNEIPGITLQETDQNEVLVTAGAGENWHELVTWCVENRYGGIENLALIPGTVGAAPIQNIGAYGVELSGVFESLRAYDIQTGSFRKFGVDECQFGYRDSWFKRQTEPRYLITSVTLRLQKPPHAVESGYKSLQEWLTRESIAEPDIADIYRGVVAIRSQKLPDPRILGNAGSFFKNPIVTREKFGALGKRFDEIPHYPAGEGVVKLPAGWLIEQAGWRGKRSGRVGTYEHQALVIVNHGGATGSEVWEFAEAIRQSVQEQFGIDLTPEVQVVGDSDEF
ncbi:MAG: UDP-N-acetylmuramate dehydrogenase [Balneolaceae bacterium]